MFCCCKLNGVNYRRLMRHPIDIINGVKEMGIEMGKCLVLDEVIRIVTNKYKSLLNKMDEVYCCIRIFIIDNNLIDKNQIHLQKAIFLWKELKLPVTPFAYSLKKHILNEMSSIEGGIYNKTEDHIERSHQVGKRLERRYQGVTDLTQSQTSQIKLQYLLFNPLVEIKLEQVKVDTSRKFNRKMLKIYKYVY